MILAAVDSEWTQKGTVPVTADVATWRKDISALLILRRARRCLPLTKHTDADVTADVPKN